LLRVTFTLNANQPFAVVYQKGANLFVSVIAECDRIFKNFFTAMLGTESEMKLSLMIPSRNKCVATPSFEIFATFFTHSGRPCYESAKKLPRKCKCIFNKSTNVESIKPQLVTPKAQHPQCQSYTE